MLWATQNEVSQAAKEGERAESEEAAEKKEAEVCLGSEPNFLLRSKATIIGERSEGISLAGRQLEGGRQRKEGGKEIADGLLHHPRILRKRDRRRRKRDRRRRKRRR